MGLLPVRQRGCSAGAGARPRGGRKRAGLAAAGTGILALALAAAGCGGSSGPSAGTTPVKGGTAESLSLASLPVFSGDKVKLNLKPEPFDQVIAAAGGNCVVTKSPCDWDVANWAGGWSFAPDFLPTGEELFLSGAVANSGGYSSSTNDALIEKTLVSNNMQDMYTWQDYLAGQLPVIWQPQADYQLNEIANNLKGTTPLSPTLSINPENWYFVK